MNDRMSIVEEQHRIQESLCRSERQFRDILENIKLAAVMLDLDGNITFCNDYLLTLAGRRREDVIGKDWFELFVAPEMRERYSTHLRSRIAQGILPAYSENQIVTSWGERRLIAWSTTLLFDGDGNNTGGVSIGQDITDRRRAEEALRESEEKYRRIVETANEGIWVIDPNCLTTYTNQVMADMLGYRAEELLGRNLVDFMYPEDLADHEAQMALRRRGVKTKYERRFRRKDDSEIHTFISAAPVIDGAGNYLGSFAMLADITEHKRAELALAESENEYRMLVSNLPAVVFRGYADWSVRFRDDQIEQLTGYPREEFNSKRIKWSDLIVEEDRKDVKKVVQEALRGNLQYVREYRIRHRDGRTIWVHSRGQLVLDRDGRIDYVSGVIFDISEHKLLEEQLAQARKMEAVGRLAGGIAHDFNNLLTGIIGYSDILFNRHREDARLRNDLRQIRNAGERAAALIHQLLAFSRKQVLEPRVLDLNLALSDMEPMLRRLIGEDIELVTVLEPALGRVLADPSQIEQVILNLVVNARDAMPSGGKVTVETINLELDENYARHHVGVQPGSYVLLAVSDTGCGMDEATLSQIFEPFFTTKEAGKGTGLGLATVYGIVKQSGGHIWAYSERDRGTTIKVYLPRVFEIIEDAGVSPPPMEELERGSETVLLVEDDDIVRDLAQTVLNECGYTVLEAGRGEEALRICEEYPGPVHLLVTDVVMPGMSGRQLATELETRCPTIRVLYVSGYTANAIVHHGILEPGIAFLQKPFTPERLARKVRHVLDAAPGTA